MPLIKKINDNILGEFKVNFSTRNNRFEFANITTPTGYDKYETMNTWDDVEKQIKLIKDATLYENMYIGKKIYLVFKSSEGSIIKSDEKWFNGRDRDILSMCDVGFELNWYVLDEFDSNGRNNLYKIIESYDNNRHKVGNMNILGQLFNGSGRELEYSDELYNFLIDTSKKLKVIINNLTKFINHDTKILMDNILKNNGQLKLGQ